ncbi:MAG: HNH endonuclease [Bacillus sp. (in: firmicutes)]
MITQQHIEWIQTGQLMKFYKCKEWMTLRLIALERDHNECQMCRDKGKYRKADCVHHIKEVKDAPRLALTLDNLMSLCNTCHNEVHDRLSIAHNKQWKFMNEERW